MQRATTTLVLPPEVWSNILIFVEEFLDLIRLRRVSKLFSVELKKKDPAKTLGDITIDADVLEEFCNRKPPSATLSQILKYVKNGPTGRILKSDNGSRYLYFTVVLVGSVLVGKTTLWKAYNEERAIHEPQSNTISTDYMIRSWHNFDTNVLSKAKIYDIGGHEMFMASPQYYDQVTGALLCFNVEDRMSLKHVVELYFRRVARYAPANVVCYLVGLKSDSTNRAVSRAEAEYIARVFHVRYFEVSAKTYNNVQELFDSLNADMLRALKIDDGPQPVRAPVAQPAQPQSRCNVM